MTTSDAGVSVDDAFRTYAAEGLTGAQWFPETTAAANATTIRRSPDGLFVVVNTDERAADDEASAVSFADESLALLALLTERRMATRDAAAQAVTDQLLTSTDVSSLAEDRPQGLLDLVVIVPFHDRRVATIDTDDGQVAATGWRGLERVGRTHAPQMRVPLSALVIAAPVSSIRVLARDSDVEIDAAALALLRAHVRAQGSVLSSGAASVGAGGSQAQRLAAIRRLGDRRDIDWFPHAGVARADCAGIARLGDTWITWAAASSPQTHATETAALDTLVAQVASPFPALTLEFRRFAARGDFHVKREGDRMVVADGGGEIRFSIRRRNGEYVLTRAERSEQPRLIMWSADMAEIERYLLTEMSSAVRAKAGYGLLTSPSDASELRPRLAVVQVADEAFAVECGGRRTVARFPCADAYAPVYNYSVAVGRSTEELIASYLTPDGSPLFRLLHTPRRRGRRLTWFGRHSR